MLLPQIIKNKSINFNVKFLVMNSYFLFLSW